MIHGNNQMERSSQPNLKMNIDLKFSNKMLNTSKEKMLKEKPIPWESINLLP